MVYRAENIENVYLKESVKAFLKLIKIISVG